MSNRSCEDCKFEKDGMICLQGHVRKTKYENLNAVGHIDLEDCHAWGEKLKCWCEYSKERRNNWNVSIIGKDGLPTPVWDIIYCPVCGGKL